MCGLLTVYEKMEVKSGFSLAYMCPENVSAILHPFSSRYCGDISQSLPNKTEQSSVIIHYLLSLHSALISVLGLQGFRKKMKVNYLFNSLKKLRLMCCN